MKTSRFFQNKRIPILVVTIITFLLYVRVIGFEYTGFDDTLLIVENQAFLQDLSNIPQAFQQDIFQVPNHPSSKAYYRPILTLSFMCDAQLGEADAKVYHSTNVLLHILACLLLLQFFCFLKLRLETAFTLTLIFAIHPVLSQAVGWIPGRINVLLTLCTLSSMLCLLRALESSKISYLLLHLLFFMLALFTKESGILLSFIGLYYLFFIVKRTRVSKPLLILLSGYTGIVLFWLVLRSIALSDSKAHITLAELSKNFLVNLPLLLQYLSKIIIPYKLSTMSTPQDTNYVLGLVVVLLILLGVALSKTKRWDRIIFGGLWFLLFLVPSFVVPKLTGFEHRVYLPLVGLLILLSELDFVKDLHLSKKTSALLIMLSSVLIAINIQHISSFKDGFSFWKTAAEASPHSSLAHLNYGAALVGKGHHEKAIETYKKGIRANPYEPMIHNNLAIAYALKGRHAEAEMEFQEEIRLNPKYSDAYYNLGMFYKTTGRMIKAARMWEETLKIDPDHKRAIVELVKHYKK